MREALLYYKPSALVQGASADLPGTKALTAYTKLYSAGAVPFDRTNTLSTPFHIRPLFPIPAMRPFEKTLEAVCNERARELLNRAVRLDVPVNVLWSGGIDSTLALTSLLKQATDDERKRITVLLSQRSIEENQMFYDSFIRGKLRTDTSSSLPYILGTRAILISGEHNDQLFGSDIMATLMHKHGDGIVYAPFDRAVLIDHYQSVLGSPELARFYVEQFERLPASSPVPIRSMFDFTWWINFTLKWQTVYARTLTFTDASRAAGITEEYLRDFYAPFYNTDDFQLWSMNNPDKRIKDTWATYKWPCKEIIYDFSKDAVYRDTKLKVGSLAAFLADRKSFKALDATLALHTEFDLKRFYNPHNDFVAMDGFIQ